MTETTATDPSAHSRPASITITFLLVCAAAWLLGPSIAIAQDSGPSAGHSPGALTGRPLYRVLNRGGLSVSPDDGFSWEDAQGLPARVLPEDRSGEPLPVTAIGVDPADASHVLAAVGARLFRSATAGKNWTEVPLGEVINRSTYVTAIAVDPTQPDRWIIGTSYDGLYLTTDAGETWTEITAEWNLDAFYLGAGFYDEVEALEIDPAGTVLVRLGMGGGFVTVDLETHSAVRLRPVTDGPRAYRAPAPVPRVTAPAGRGLSPRDGTLAGEAAARRARAADRTGVYVAATNASPGKVAQYLDYIVSHGFDSIVVDLKDDYGRVTYETALEMPRDVGAVDPMVDVRSLVENAHARGVYVIARIVLFKDRRLYRFDNGRYALWDSGANRPWGVYRTVTDEETGESQVVQVEHWVDPYADEVRRYNIDIAAEAASLGVDEIQFDYVRFPSDGVTDTLTSRFAPPGADRVQALEAFLSEARSEIAIPIGIDVFGFNAWSRMSYLGQDITRLRDYVDVISPMFYPSHFARAFLPKLSYMERSRIIYHDGTRRARIMTTASEPVLIRPYVQAFLIGPELEYEEPEYRRYLDLQIVGSESGASSGYTLWNSSGRYYMLP